MVPLQAAQDARQRRRPYGAAKSPRLRTAFGDVVRKVVKTGDVIVIPAGVPHGWTDIGDHVDYLSFRPSGQTLTAGYVNPAIKK